MLKNQTKHELGKNASTVTQILLVLTEDLHGFTTTVSLRNDFLVYCKQEMVNFMGFY